MDDDVDPELVALLRQTLLTPSQPHQALLTTTYPRPITLKVLSSAEYIANHALDVFLDARLTKHAAENIYRSMREKKYSMSSWSSHELHPVPPPPSPIHSKTPNPDSINGNTDDDEMNVQNETEKEIEIKREKERENIVNFIFTMDLLNFSFWSSEDDVNKQYGVDYRGKKWTGYWSLVASLQRALDEDIPITTPSFWIDLEKCPDEKIRHVFRSCTEEEMPMLEQRIECLREAGRVLCDVCSSFLRLVISIPPHVCYSCSVLLLLKKMENSVSESIMYIGIQLLIHQLHPRRRVLSREVGRSTRSTICLFQGYLRLSSLPSRGRPRRLYNYRRRGSRSARSIRTFPSF